MSNSYEKKQPKNPWISTDLHVITRTVLKTDSSIRRNTFVEQNWIANCDLIYADQVDNYRIRFTTKIGERLDKTIQPSTRLIIEKFRFSTRKGRKEREIEVRKFRIVGNDWRWMIGVSQTESDTEFLRGGTDLEDIFYEHQSTSLSVSKI
jgi:hypothetical protein